MKKISIITINLNNAEGLEKTIKTVINQNYSDYEYIVIDGASIDGSIDVIKKHQEKISYWISEKDRGIYNAMNKGIIASRKLSNEKDKYLLFLNSGDRLYSNDVLENIAKYDEDIVIGKIIRDDFEEPFGFYNVNLTMHDVMRRGFPHQATFFALHLFDDYMYDESYKIISDWKFFVQKIIFENVSYINIGVIVSEFDTGGLSTTNHDLLVEEVRRAHRELMPPRMLSDFEKISHLDDEWINIGDALFFKVGMKRIIYGFARLILFLNKIKLRSSFSTHKYNQS